MFLKSRRVVNKARKSCAVASKVRRVRFFSLDITQEKMSRLTNTSNVLMKSEIKWDIGQNYKQVYHLRK